MANEKLLFVDPATGFYTEDKAAITVYNGTAGADSVVKTNGSGKIDNTLINFAAFDAVFEARVASNTNVTLTAPGAAIDGVTLVSGDRVFLFGQTDATQNGIYVWTGSAATLTRATNYDETGEISAGDLVVISEGTNFHERVYILATNDSVTVGTTALSFVPLGTSLVDAGVALSYSGTTLNVNYSTGLTVASNALLIDFAVTSTMNVSKAVKASDLVGFGTLQGGKIIGYDKTATAAYTTATTVQQAIDDAYAFAAAPGVLYTAATGGLTKGQLVYISANDTAAPYSAIGTAQDAIGLAYTSGAAGSQVRVVHDSTVLTGILTGAVAGTRYYWNGSGYTTSIPASVSQYVWEVGFAKNATDLQVDVKFLKRNSAT